MLHWTRPLRRNGSVGRGAFAVGGLLAVLAISALASALTFQRPVRPTGGAPTPTPSAPRLPDWLTNAVSYGRVVHVDVRVAPSATGSVARFTCVLTTTTADPLVDIYRSGVGISEVSTSLFGGYQCAGMATVNRTSGSEVVTVTVENSTTPAPSDDSRVSVQYGPSPFDQQPSVDPVVTFSMNVVGDGLHIVSVRGPSPTSQSANAVSFGASSSWIDVEFSPVDPAVSRSWSQFRHELWDRDDPLVPDWAWWIVTAAVPWLLLLLYLRASDRRWIEVRRGALVAIGILVAAAVLTAIILTQDLQRPRPPIAGVAADLLFGLTLTTPLLLAIWFLRLASRPIPTWLLVGCGGLGLAILLGLVGIPIAGHPGYLLIAGPGLAVSTLATLGAVRRWRPWAAPAALVVWTFTTSLAVPWLIGAMPVSSGYVTDLPSVLVLATLGLMWSPLFVVGVMGDRRRAMVQGLVGLTAAISLLPIGEWLVDRPGVFGFVYEISRYGDLPYLDQRSIPPPTRLFQLSLVSVGLVLVAASTVVLLRRGSSGRYDDLSRPLGIVVAASAAAGFTGTPRASVAMVLVGVGVASTIPRVAMDRANRLAAVPVTAHRRLVALESWRRLSAAAARRHFLAGKALGADSDARHELLAGQYRLDAAAGGPRYDQSARSGQVRLSEASLGSAAGHSAAKNAVAAAVVGTVLATALMVHETHQLLAQPEFYFYKVGQLADAAKAVLRWAAYAFLYGYFYPWIRGGTPLTKAYCLFLALLPAEVLPIVALSTDLGDDAVIAATIRFGQLTVFALALGLWWERRLVRAAGLNWYRIRDFRSARSLGAPLITIGIAVVTVVATTLATATVNSILQPATVPAPPSSSAAPSK